MPFLLRVTLMNGKLMFVVGFGGFTTTGVIETHLLPFASFCDFPPLPSATAYGLPSLINLVGMIAAGLLADRVNRPALLVAIYGLSVLTFITLES